VFRVLAIKDSNKEGLVTMWLAEITFPSGSSFTTRICSLGTAMYWARVFGCNVFVTFSFFGFGFKEN